MFSASLCGSGRAVQSEFQWACPSDLPANSAPTGGGLLCYTDEASCAAGPNSCNTTGNPTPCTQQAGLCASGLAAQGRHSGGGATFTWVCGADLGPLALPTGSGVPCYADRDTCTADTNPCNGGTPCTLVSAPSISAAIDPLVAPGPKQREGAPRLSCCRPRRPPPQDYSLCSTGLAGASPLHHYTCEAAHIAPPNAAGATCHASVGACTRAPNACDDSFPCAPNAGMCQTGLASADESHPVFCNRDVPPGALTNGGGQYCFSSQAACDAGPNSVRGEGPADQRPAGSARPPTLPRARLSAPP